MLFLIRSIKKEIINLNLLCLVWALQPLKYYALWNKILDGYLRQWRDNKSLFKVLSLPIAALVPLSGMGRPWPPAILLDNFQLSTIDCWLNVIVWKFKQPLWESAFQPVPLFLTCSNSLRCAYLHQDFDCVLHRNSIPVGMFTPVNMYERFGVDLPPCGYFSWEHGHQIAWGESYNVL